MERLALTSVDSITTIINGEYRFDTNVKPELSFDFDSVYYEPEVDRFIKIVDSQALSLSPEEQEECREYIKNYINNADFPVYAYNEKNIYVGMMKKSEAVERGINYVILEQPQYPVSKWMTDHWEPVYAIISDSGVLTMNPLSFCEACVVFLTKEEFEAFPKQPNSNYIYDIENNEWVDPRKHDELVLSVQQEIRNFFERLRQKEWEKYIPQYEQSTWQVQLNEATSWLADNTVATPYIDTFLSHRKDSHIPTKQELCEDIVANSNAYITVMAKINAAQWYYLKLAIDTTTNDELDRLIVEIRTSNCDR